MTRSEITWDEINARVTELGQVRGMDKANPEFELEYLRAEVVRLRARLERQHIRHQRFKALENKVAALESSIAQVDDVLVVNWIAVKDGDYRQALSDLVTWEIMIHDDPAVSQVAAKRRDLLRRCLEQLRESEPDNPALMKEVESALANSA